MKEFAVQELTLGQLLENTAARFPDNDAVIHADRDLRQTWSEFSDCVDTMARGLMALGVQKGEKVAVWATNVPHWLTLMFATARIGAVLVTVNTNYRNTELLYLLQQSESENLFIIEGVRDHDFIASTYEVIPELRRQKRGMLQVESLPHLKRVFFLGSEKHRGMYSLPEVFSLAGDVSDEAYERRKASVSPYDVVNMQYTSGTTGFPKGVMLTHVNIVNNGYWIGFHQKFSQLDRVCLPVPLFHCFGCVLGVMACVNHGAAMVLLEAFSPVQVMSAVDQERCTALYGVPTMFQAMLDHRVFSRFDFTTLRTGIMAGSVCPEPLMRRVMDRLGMREITICYGLTEGSPVMTQTRTDDSVERRVTTVGRHMPGIEVTIRDPETNKEVPPHTVGEVCCRGYNVMQGYYNMPEATAEAIDAEGWLHSGDLGSMDEEGYVSISGRIKDMIIRGGENVYPREVEEFLLKMEGVFDVQVVAVPSRRYGEEVGAFLIAKEGADLAPEDVRDYCRGKIAWYKIPRYVAVVDAFPLTASGKIQKYKLREMAARYFPEAMRERHERTL
ncbi:MAG TPA: AMP-binding protein [Candidatus Bilophila faecipullorum]|uniref:AMP-binding protein n=1 Tax=Candidatus Bilophila faecipullorum TaxID=2838482 RepID=A0A9D1QZ15_9BACT|nr:AMP-binding protein [uncultured Bilophila sp.]HIW78681.1 AMP-binding protein [Candidatus Bilophila faecipullorum]